MHVNAFSSVVDSEKLPTRLNMVMFDRLQKVIAPQVFTRPAVYDGRKNAFTTYRLSLGPNDSAGVLFLTIYKFDGN